MGLSPSAVRGQAPFSALDGPKKVPVPGLCVSEPFVQRRKTVSEHPYQSS